jgi:flotillin
MYIDFDFVVIGAAFLAVFLFVLIVFLASRYKRCSSNQILVIYGKVGGGKSSRCLHGGGAFIWPLIQAYKYLDLTPLTINIPLKGALSQQNIRVNVPSTFTVAIATEEESMNAAAVRLLGLSGETIESMATEIILGQLRLTVASLTIEQINQDRERFLDAIRKNIDLELDKIGLCLINVNVTDITDESGYIESIGKKAALTAINQAKVDVAEQDKKGAIGEAQARKEQQIRVAQFSKEQHIQIAEFTKEQEVRNAALDKEEQVQLAQFAAEREVKKAEFQSGQQVQVAEYGKEQQIKTASFRIEEQVRLAELDREQRIQTASHNARAVEGENTAKAEIADSNAALAEREAEAGRRGETARNEAFAVIQQSKALAEERRLEVEQIVPREIEKRKLEINAAAQAEQQRLLARGEADALLLVKAAEAEGLQKVLDAKARGYEALVKAANGNAGSAATLLLLEKLEDLVKLQTEAVKNIKIDKLTVWDNPSGEASSTANFMRNLVKTLPPLHDIAEQAGLELPAFLGTMAGEGAAAPPEEERGNQAGGAG